MSGLTRLNLQFDEYGGGLVLKVTQGTKLKCHTAYVGMDGLTSKIEHATILNATGIVEPEPGPVQNNTFGFTSFDFPFL